MYYFGAFALQVEAIIEKMAERSLTRSTARRRDDSLMYRTPVYSRALVRSRPARREMRTRMEVCGQCVMLKIGSHLHIYKCVM